MAVLVVAPVDDVDGAVGTVLEIDAHERAIGGKQQIEAGVEGFVSRTLTRVVLLVQLMPVEIERKR
jgi:hypothetical protein